MIKIAFCDNEKEQLSLFKNFCLQYNKEHNDLLINATFYDNGFDLMESNFSSFDAIFLDIDMPMMNGMEVAEKIRDNNEEINLIFITMIANYAIKGYKVKALDYILKPVPYFEFSLIIDKLLLKKSKEKEQYFLIQAKNNMKKINYNDIFYFEMFNHDVYIHGKDEFSFRGTLKEIELRINKEQFVRCNNSFIINLQYVDEIKGDFVYLKSGEKIEITKSRRKEFFDRLVSFVGN